MFSLNPGLGQIARCFEAPSQDVGGGDPQGEDQYLNHVPNEVVRLSQAYSDTLDSLIEQIRSGVNVHIHGTTAAAKESGVVDARSKFSELEAQVFQRLEPAATLTPAARVPAFVNCIYGDLQEILKGDPAHFSKLLASLDSSFGTVLRAIVAPPAFLPPDAVDLYQQVQLADDFAGRSLPTVIRAALLIRSLRRYPERVGGLEEGQDYRIAEFLNGKREETSPKKPTPKELRLTLGVQLADLLLESISDHLQETLATAASFITNKQSESCGGILAKAEWARNVGLFWRERTSQASFPDLIDQKEKKEIFCILYKVLRSKIRIARELGVTFEQAISPTYPFRIAASRYHVCMRMIDSFSINQILSVWNETGAIPLRSFAMNERCMRAKNLLPESQGGPPRIQIDYYRGFEEERLTFVKGALLRDSSSGIPVCAWVLYHFLLSAKEILAERKKDEL